jgi:hypothetical protein
MEGGKRALTSWNIFVKKVYSEGKRKNENYSFQEALKDASKRKSEMGNSPTRGVKQTKKRSTLKRKHSSTRRHRKR